jgi:hypothetical protein
MAITPLPTAPSRSDPNNFSARADAFMTALPTFVTEANALQADVTAKQVTASTAEVTATTQATNASASSAAAAISANNAAASTGAVLWVSGTTYNLGVYVRSPANARIYRKLTASSSTTIDPSTDVTNYIPVFLEISSGYPTVQPTLNLDFANSKTVDPRITFVRNSTAAYYDGQTTAMAEQNLLLQSQAFATTWVTSNTTLGSVTTAPDGTTTAYPLTASAINGTLLQTFTATATAYTFSIYIQRVTGTGNIDITVDGTTYATQATSGTWTRFTITTTPAAGSKTAGIRLAVSGDVVNISGAQLEQRSSATAYTPTTTAAITNYIPQLMTAPAGVPRLDYNPTTSQALGLLIEEGRTNLLNFSSSFAASGGSQNNWLDTSITRTAAAFVAPDSTQVGIQFTASAANATVISTAAVGTSLARTFSVWLKRISGTGVINYTLDNGATWIAQTITSTVTRYTFAATTANQQVGFQIVTSGDSIGIWGAQLEAGAFATSYIPTVASTVTRAADAASMTGTNFSSWYNQAQGSFYWESNSTLSTVSALTWELYAPIPSLITASGWNNTNGGLARFITSGSTTVNQIAGSIVAGTTNKYSATTKPGTGNNILALNGVVQATTASPAWMNVPTGLYLYDVNSAGTVNTLNGHIRKLSYYPIALSSSNLVALTS